MGYIDVHSHILFDVDHGIAKKEDYVEMLKKYKESGISTIFLTPHIYNPAVHTKTENLRKNFLEAQAEAEKLGIRVELGSELYLSSQITVKTLPVLGKFALVEFPVKEKPVCWEKKLESLQNQDLTIIIAHVERYSRWMKAGDANSVFLKGLGCYFQVNVSSIEDKTAMPYLKNGMAELVGSDNHGDFTLPSRLADVYRKYPFFDSNAHSLFSF